MPACSGRGIWVFARQGETRCPCIAGGISPARRADKKEETYGFLLLANHPLSLRRATGAVDRSPAKRLPPTCCCDRQGLTATPEGRGISLLAAFEKWAAILWRNAPLRASARPYLRQQMPQIFGQKLWCLLLLRRKRGDSQEGRKLGFSLFASRSERACEQPPAGRLLASRSAPAPRRRTHPAARRRRIHTGICWVMQWILPPPIRISRAGMATTSRVGNSACKMACAFSSIGSPNAGMTTARLAI